MAYFEGQFFMTSCLSAAFCRNTYSMVPGKLKGGEKSCQFLLSHTAFILLLPLLQLIRVNGDVRSNQSTSLSHEETETQLTHIGCLKVISCSTFVARCFFRNLILNVFDNDLIDQHDIVTLKGRDRMLIITDRKVRN